MFITLLTVTGLLKFINEQPRPENAMCTTYGCSVALCVFRASCKLAFRLSAQQTSNVFITMNVQNRIMKVQMAYGCGNRWSIFSCSSIVCYNSISRCNVNTQRQIRNSQLVKNRQLKFGVKSHLRKIYLR